MTRPGGTRWSVPEAGSTDEEAPAGGPTRRTLLDERAFLLRSLRDLEDERTAGDLDDDDYRALRSRYTARAAAVLRALAGTGDGPAAGAPVAGDTADEGSGRAQPAAVGAATVAGDRRRRRRRLLVGGAVSCFVVAAVVLVVAALGVGLPGDVVTGSPTLTRPQQVQRLLAQGEAALLENQSADALDAFEQVLQLQPTQVEALSEAGWLEFAAGVHAGDRALVRQGQRDESAAVRRAPGQFGPRLYLGAMLAQEGQASAAAAQFEAGLSDDPPATTVAVFAPTIDKAFGEAHVPVPPAVGAAVASVAAGGRG